MRTELDELIAWAQASASVHGRKPKLRVSVSGGRTSMFMAKWCKDNLSQWFDILYQFANTSREHADTYRFLEAGDAAFGLGIVWVEAEVHKGRKACTARVVTPETARKDSSIFEAVMKKYGLPNQTFLHCTRELKTNPMDHHADVAGFGDALVAIGIRADERRRVSKNATKNRLIYPLVDMVPTTKLDVLEFFEDFEWDLRIPEWDGNCVDCHKKSDRKLQAVWLATPEVFEWSMAMDDRYKKTGPNSVAGVRVDDPRKRFRGYRDTRELIDAIRDVPASALAITEGGCSESCEVYETEDAA
jgi:hypothetical protein